MAESDIIEAKIEALRAQCDFFRSIDMDAAADHCEQAAIGWEGSLLDIQRAEACGCFRCIGSKPTGVSFLTVGMTRMIVCRECGNKRCPHGTDHRNECTASNEPGQEGSRYATTPTPAADESGAGA